MIPVEPPVRKKLESAPGAPEQDRKVPPADWKGLPPMAAAAVPEQDFQEPMPGFPAELMVRLAYPAESQRECPGFADP